MNDFRDGLRPVDIVVRLWISENADVMEIVQEMDYHFRHDDIIDTVIEDILTEV